MHEHPIALTEEYPYPEWAAMRAVHVLARSVPYSVMQYVHSHMITTGGAAT